MIRIYAAQGHRRFLLLTGYLGEQIEAFVADRASWPEPVEIECVDTGLDTNTGGRVARAAERLARRALLPHLRRRRRRHRPRGPGGAATREHGARGDDDRRPPVQPVGDRADRRRRSGSPAFARSRGSTTGSTAASSSASPAFLDTLGDDSVLEREPLERARRRRAASAPTATTASGTAWTPTRTRSRSTTSGSRDGALGGLGARGGRGLMGVGAGHRRARLRRRLARQGAARARRRGRLARPAPRRAAARRPSALLGIEDEVDRGRGRPQRRRRWSRRARASTGSTTSFTSPPRRSSARSQASPVRGFETNVRGTWTAARGLPRARRRAGRRRLLRQGLRRPRRASVPRGLRAPADRAVRGVEGGRRPDRAQLLALATGCRSR